MDKEDEEPSKSNQSPHLDPQHESPPPTQELNQPEAIGDCGLIGEAASSGGISFAGESAVEAEVVGVVGISVSEKPEGPTEVEGRTGDKAVGGSVLAEDSMGVVGVVVERKVNGSEGLMVGEVVGEGSAGARDEVDSSGVGADDVVDKSVLDLVGDVEAVMVEVNENEGFIDGVEAVEGKMNIAVGAKEKGNKALIDLVRDVEVVGVVGSENDQKVGDGLDEGGLRDTVIENVKGDREVVNVRNDVGRGDMRESRVISESQEELAMAEERGREGVADVVEDKQLTEDASVVEEPTDAEMPEVMKMEPIKEMVDSKELMDVHTELAEAHVETIMPGEPEDRAISEVLEGGGMIEDANVADKTGNTTFFGMAEGKELAENVVGTEGPRDTVMHEERGQSLVAKVEGKEFAENVVAAKGSIDTAMHEGTEELAVAEGEVKEFVDDANAPKKPEDTATHEAVEGMPVDNLVEVKELAGDEDMANAPKGTLISEASIDSETPEALEVNKSAEDADVVDTCMTDSVKDTEMTKEIETDVVEEGGKAVAGKRKRGRHSAKNTPRKKMEEDVCFICFDGGDLVLCDRRGCPKAYHPACVNRDEAFFRTKGQWNCGWHLCNVCGKSAHYMCYTCAYSLCKKCTKEATILCVRENKGFCETCMKTIMLIEENNQQNIEQAEVNFDDKSSWEYLFKDYWLNLKGRLFLTMDELAEAKNPWKGVSGRHDLPDELNDPNSSGVTASDNNAKRKKGKKRLKAGVEEESSARTKMEMDSVRPSTNEGSEWASKELLEFVMHMKNGDKSVVSQFDVQALLLEYIKRNKLRDPRRKSQIVCDSMLQNLFGKQRVGHFEMLKLLESHFLVKEDPQADDLQGSVVDTDTSQMEVDGESNSLTKTSKDKKRKNRRKGDGRVAQTNRDDYAAIDIHNINLIYLRRNLVEELLEDFECFQEKVVGAFVRIRIYGSNQKQDIYRLVQVVGTTKTAEPYKVGKRMTDIVLEILNLNKTEIISIDVISNQDFTEDECKRLRQSIKCGLINRLTVGDILEKAMVLQAVRVNDCIQSEMMKLSHLRDRASDLGRRKELRECVEKLQLLKTPEERERRLEEVPDVHADPKMDPSHESEEEEDDKKREAFMTPRITSFNKKARESVSPRKGFSASGEPWGENSNHTNMNRELTRNSSSKEFLNRSGESSSGEKMNKWNQGREKEVLLSMNEEKSKVVSASQGTDGYTYTKTMHQSVSSVVSVYSPVHSPSEVAQSSDKINESEKLWHYRDPSGKIQGPFSMVQLRKWNNTGYFPADLRIWKSTEKQDESILLTDALTGKFQKDPVVLERSTPKTPVVDCRILPPAYSGKPHGILHQLKEGQGGETLQTKLLGYSANGLSSDISRREDLTNLPSPTPLSIENKVQSYESKRNPNSLSARLEGSASEANPLSGDKVIQHSSAAISVADRLPRDTPLGLSSVRVGGTIDDSNFLNMSPTPGPEKTLPISLQMHSQSTMAGVSHTNPNMLHAIDPPGIQANVGASLQNLLISGGGINPPLASQGFVTAPSQNVEPSIPNVMPSQSSAYGHWGSASSNASGSFGIPNSAGVPPSESWGSAVHNNQTNIRPIGTSNLPTSVGLVYNPGAIPGRGQENQITTHGQIPVAGNPTTDWGGPHPGNPNMPWGAPSQGPALGTSNPSWATHGQVSTPASGQTPAPGNAIPGWGPGNQRQPVTMNSNWLPPGQGLPPGNANPGQLAPTGTLGRWGADHNSNQQSFSGQRDRISHGGDTAYGRDRVSHGRDTVYDRDRVSHGDGRGRPWNRQSSTGSGARGASRSFPKGRGVCKFHENGHCKKGASCDYLHT